jgi:hypothetical protein
VQLHDLRAVQQTLAAVGNEVGLCGAPVAQGGRPRLRAAQVEALLARLDDAAVDVAGDDGGDGAARHRDHDLVEQRHALGAATQADQRPALAVARQRHEVGVGEALADGVGPAERGVRVGGVSREDRHHPADEEQVALLDAVAAVGLE